MSLLRVQTPYELAVNTNKIDGSKYAVIAANNPSVGVPGQEDLWDGGGVYTFLTTAQPLYISSSNASDTQLILVQGLDSDWNPKSVFTTLNGRTQVLVGTFIRVNSALNYSATRHAGDVYVAEQDTLTAGVPDTATKIKSVIKTANQRTLNGFYSVPAGKKADFIRLGASVGKGKDAAFIYKVRLFGGVFLSGQPVELYQTTWSIDYSMIPGVYAKNDILFSVSTNTPGTSVSAYGLLLIRNE